LQAEKALARVQVEMIVAPNCSDLVERKRIIQAAYDSAKRDLDHFAVFAASGSVPDALGTMHSVVVNGRTLRFAQVPGHDGTAVILANISNGSSLTCMLFRLRPEWSKVASELVTARSGKPGGRLAKYEVFICTAARKEYAAQVCAAATFPLANHSNCGVLVHSC
jgi:hypothetical protein